jgi:asparagine synthetase B (glutamine-hydrolysing)
MDCKNAGIDFGQAPTPMILHLYEELDPNASKLNGMFAFALWDAKQELLFWRATVPAKTTPLLHIWLFLFASEIKALLQHPHVERNLDYKSAAQIFGYEYVLAQKFFNRSKIVSRGIILFIATARWKLPSTGMSIEDQLDQRRTEPQIIEELRGSRSAVRV